MEHKIYINNIDWLRAIFYSHLRNKVIWGICIFFGLSIYSATYIGLWSMGLPLIETVITTAGFAFWIIMIQLISFILTSLSLLLNPKWRKGRIGEHLITITENGVLEETPYNKTEIKWPSINKITETKDICFISIGANDVMVIPKRCFSETEWSAFNEKIRSHVSISR